MSLEPTREERRQLERDNAKQPLVLTEVPESSWPAAGMPPRLVRVWRSREFLVQAFVVDNPAVFGRLSVNRTQMLGSRWMGDISWDDLQRVKRECGFSHMCAVEVFPPDADLVNVANIRHLWLMHEVPDWAWRRNGTPIARR